MKIRLWFIIGMYAVFSILSCNDDRYVTNTLLVKTISVTGQDFQNGDAGTRASYAVDETGFHFTWTAGDTVGIYPVGGDQVAFPISSGEGNQTAQFDGGTWALRANCLYTAYYPFNTKNYHVKETSIPVSYLKQSQNGNGSLDVLDEFDYQASVAEKPDADGNVNITLKHLGCFVRFQLTMPVADTFNKIELKSDKTPFITTGTFDLTKDDIFITPITTSSSMEISLSNITTTAQDNILTVYALFAPVDLSDSKINITVMGIDDHKYTVIVDGKKMVSGKSYSYNATMTTEYPTFSETESKYGDLTIYKGFADSTDVTSFNLSAQIDGLSSLEGSSYAVYFYYSDTNVEPNESNAKRIKANLNDNSARCSLNNMNMCSTYFYRLAVGTFDGDVYYGPVNSFTVKDIVTKGDKIDMGIPGVLFASCNLGAASPEQKGDSYAWGETETKRTFNESNYIFYNSNLDVWREIGNDISGTQYDAAAAILGDGWHIPNSDIMECLTASCKRKNISYKGVVGNLMISTNGNSIFMPKEYYWTSSYCPDNVKKAKSWNGYYCDGDRYSGYLIRPVIGDINYPMEYVDLGLSVKWATCNVGAIKPEYYGNYYAWGETETKSRNDWQTYKWCNGSYFTQTKYNISSSYGTVDNKTILDPEDDVAHVKWGGSWRMPTKAELDELRDNCTWTWTTLNGVNGCLVTSNKEGYTDCSIFLPAAGFHNASLSNDDVGSGGCYWSSSLYTDEPYDAWFLKFDSGGRSSVGSSRGGAQSVRPVCP